MQALEYILVAVIVAACAIFSTWRLLGGGARLRLLDLLARLPGAAGARWSAGLRQRMLTRLGSGCGSCAANTLNGSGRAATRSSGAPHR